jgi:hypothetical protein
LPAGSAKLTSRPFPAVDQGPQRADDVAVLDEHDWPSLGVRHRLGPGQEVVAGGDESGNVGAGVGPPGAGDIGVDGAHLAGEGSADGGGVGIRGYPEPGGGIHDLVNHVTLLAELGRGRDDVRAGPAPEVFSGPFARLSARAGI